jgi:hypothetical protein
MKKVFDDHQLLQIGSGTGLDLSLGAYSLRERPTDAPEWQLKFGVSYLFNQRCALGLDILAGRANQLIPDDLYKATVRSPRPPKIIKHGD